MAANDELDLFVREALSRGASRDQIAHTLKQAGWEAAQIQGALDAFADIEFAVPVPRPRPYLSARDAFLYLLLFATLYVMAFNFGRLMFLLIERTFPDASMQDAAYFSQRFATGARWAVASLLVASPVFLLVSRITTREVVSQPAKRGSMVRRWLTYLTLFIAAGILIGDFITVLYNALGGELSVRFTLKALVVAAIGGSVFWYYLWDMRGADSTSERAESSTDGTRSAPNGKGVPRA